eukprot:scaffold5.g675.t1
MSYHIPASTVQYLLGSHIERVTAPSPLEFLREYVAPNKPAVITGAIDHWPALRKWSEAYLAEAAGDTIVTVALTPNGRADAVTPLPDAATPLPAPAAQAAAVGGAHSSAEQGERRPSVCFALPHQDRLPLRAFLRLLRASGTAASAARGSGSPDSGAGTSGAGCCPYLQFQNSSLTAELPELLGDVEAELPWATEALGGPPEAVNLWIGDTRSTSSLHKDPFENLYAVVAGSKTFTLLPPSDVWRVQLRRYPLATYRPVGPGCSCVCDSCTAGHSGSCGGCGCCGCSGCSAPVARLLALRLEPVLHEPHEEVLWSSIQPESLVASCGAGGDASSDAGSSSAGSGSDSAGSSDADDADEGPASSGGGRLLQWPGAPPPLRVTVRAGEVLYLPAMWWHQVEQEEDEGGLVLAVNFWHDMRFDGRHAAVGAVEALAAALGLNERPAAAALDTGGAQIVRNAAFSTQHRHAAPCEKRFAHCQADGRQVLMRWREGCAPPCTARLAATTAEAAAARDLVAWVEANGGSAGGVAVQALEGGQGYGLIAAPCPAGTPLITLPRGCHLSYDGSSADPRLLRLIAQVPEELWGARLALQVLAERVKGGASSFAPYVAALPVGVPGLPMFFHGPSLAALEYPPVTEQVQGTADDPFGGAAVDANALGWALGVVTSRAFRTRGPSQPASMVASRDLAAGEPVLLSYGPLSNDFLLMDYGFVVEGNPHDTVQLRFHPGLIEARAGRGWGGGAAKTVTGVKSAGPTSTDPDAPLPPPPAWQQAALATLGLGGEGAGAETCLRWAPAGGGAPCDARLLAGVRVLCAANAAELAGRGARLEGLGDWERPLSAAGEVAALRTLSGLCAITLSQFSCGLDDDLAMLAGGRQQQQAGDGGAGADAAQQQAPEALSPDVALAVRFRAEKKRLVLSAIARLSERLQQLLGSDGGAGGSSASGGGVSGGSQGFGAAATTHKPRPKASGGKQRK